MTLKKVDAGIVVVLLVVGIGAFAMSTGWTTRSRMFVQVVSVPLVVLSMAQLGLAIRGLRQAVPKEPKDGGSAMDLSIGAGLPPEVVWRRGLSFSLWLTGFFCAIWAVGFFAGGLTFIAIYMYVSMRERPVPIGLMVVAIWLFMTGIQRIFNFPFPRGVVTRMLG